MHTVTSLIAPPGSARLECRSATLPPFTSSGRLWDGPEEHIDAELIQVVVVELDDLIEAFALNVAALLLKKAVLPLNHGLANRTLTGPITRNTSFQRNIEQEHYTRHTMFACQVKEILTRLRCERGGIHDG